MYACTYVRGGKYRSTCKKVACGVYAKMRRTGQNRVRFEIYLLQQVNI